MLGKDALLTIISCFSLLSLTRCKKLSSGPQCFFWKDDTLFNTKYVQDGDIIIGGIFTVTSICRQIFLDYKSHCHIPVPRYYRYILSFIYAIDEINKSSDLLPNVSLGYHVTDSCNTVNKAIDNTLQILSGTVDSTPNYRCAEQDNLIGLIGDFSSQRSLQIAEILNIYGYIQISYGATDPILTNKQKYPLFFQTLPSDQTQFLAIVKLLRHYGWTWIGVITSDDDDGGKQSQELKKVAAHYGICIEFNIKIPDMYGSTLRSITEKGKAIFNYSTSQVVVLCGKILLSTIYFIEKLCSGASEKTYILPASMNVNVILTAKFKSFLHGSFVFSPITKKIPELKRFLDGASHANRPNDLLLEHILATHLKCLTSNSSFNSVIELAYDIQLHYCNESVQLRELGSLKFFTERFGTTYQIYTAIYAIAHSLHEMQLYTGRNPSNSYKMQYFLRRVHFHDPTGEDIYFTDRGEMSTFYYIHNYAVLTDRLYNFRKVGYFNASSHAGKELTIIDQIQKHWKHNQTPVSVCSAECPCGYRRVIMRGIHHCCFHCVKCSEGEISNDTDNALCHKCPDDQWPNDKNQCVPKPIEFLSYKNDPLALVLSIIGVLFFVKTLSILVLFIFFRDTPIIKANNRALSFILLVSIMLSFLCVLLFPGRPVHITCMLRHTSFGIIFSVAISCILAKTIMVYMAFTATKPGSYWRKFIGVKATNCVVLICSFIQVLINIFWLCILPPFVQMNTYTYTNKNILECNEGSILGFSMVLGYMGLLASVSFVVAFLARNLPDSFNEAKYITFSMLVFCSVWLSFIPAYMSVTGKFSVLVEIFAILSSNIGILSCIIFPKCYIILIRPDLNSRSNLLRKAHGSH